MDDRSCITLVRCNQVCTWMNIIRKLHNKSINFKMKMLFRSYLICFAMTLVWNWISVRRVCFDSEVFGTGSTSSSRVDISPTTVLTNFCPQVGEISVVGLSLREGEIPTTELGSHSLSSEGNLINGVVKPGLWGRKFLQQVWSPNGKNPTAECFEGT